MSNEQRTRKVYVKQGIGFPMTLTIVFIVLKLTNVVDWSWVWVVSPLWISYLFFLACALFVFLILGIGAVAGIVADVIERRRHRRIRGGR